MKKDMPVLIAIVTVLILWTGVSRLAAQDVPPIPGETKEEAEKRKKLFGSLGRVPEQERISVRDIRSFRRGQKVTLLLNSGKEKTGELMKRDEDNHVIFLKLDDNRICWVSENWVMGVEWTE